jgi:hypothetical protein
LFEISDHDNGRSPRRRIGIRAENHSKIYATFLIMPFERRATMWARERKRIHAILPSGEDHIVGAVYGNRIGR